MTFEQLRTGHQTRPFRPFVMRLADGSRLKVPHPEFLAYTPKGRTAVVMRLDETFEIVDLMLVTTLEIIDGKPRPSRKQS